MTEQEFVDLINNCTNTYYTKEKPPWEKDRFKPRSNNTKSKVTLDHDYLYVEWISGGISGGSCWDEEETDNHRPTEGEPEEEFNSLDNVLTETFPNLTFLQYKQISKLIKYDSRTEDEYYGNSTSFSCKYIKLRDLYNKLKEMKLI